MFKVNKKLTWILAVSFVVTIAYAFVFRIHPVVDARAYDVIAQNLLAGNGFVENPDVAIEYDNAIVRVGPLYQFFLAGNYAVFGRNFEVIWILQALLHVLTAYLVHKIALVAFKYKRKKETIALWSAGIFAFYPDLIEISAMLMTETLYLFLWVLFIWLFVKYLDKHRGNFFSKITNCLEELKMWWKVRGTSFFRNEWFAIAVLGLVSGLAVLARPPVLFVLPLLFIFLWSKKQWALSALFFVMLAVVFTPWTMRNYNQFDRIMPFGGAGNYNFWIGNHVGASGEQETGEEIAHYLANNGAIALYDASVPKFKEFVVENPSEFGKLTLFRISRYFSVIRPMGFWFYDNGFSQFAFILSSAAASVFLFVMSLFGIIKIWFQRNDTVIKYLLWMIALTPLILFVTVVETRYRFQIYPLLTLFAGYGVVDWLNSKKRLANKHIYIAMAVVVANGLIDLVLSWDKFQEKLSLFI